jgi:hypothetical protein
MTTDPKEILQQIRSEGRPLVNIHTGPLESIREMSPGAIRANEYVEEWLENPDHQASADETAQSLESQYVDISAWEHALGWAHTEDDVEAWELERRVILARAKAGDKGCEKLFPHMMTTDAFNAFGWHGKWYHYGCQSLDIEEKYAASLCATKIAPSELEHVRLPWPCFLVRVPKFLQGLIVNGEPLRVIAVNHVIYNGAAKVTAEDPTPGASSYRLDMEQYRLTLLTANKYRLLPCNSLAQWANPNPKSSYDEFRLVEVEYGEQEQRQLEVIGRLVLGAIIAMNDPKLHKTYGRLHPGKKPSLGSPRHGTNNEVALHKIGRPVKVDARETISSYVSGKTGRVTNVRTLVAGHWKNQPHGPKNSLRRWQHIECYWRGEDDAPMIIRPHALHGE